MNNTIKIKHSDKYIYNKEDNCIYTLNGDMIKTEIINGVKKIKLDWVYGTLYYEFGLVVIVTVYNINIPIANIKDVLVCYIDNNRYNTYINNIFYKFACLIEHTTIKGFYYIPYHTNYLISANLDLYSLLSNRIKLWHIAKPGIINIKNITSGYKRTSVTNDIGNNTALARHRAVGLTFIDYTTDPNKLVINHKNGTPGDDDLDNLEWVTKRDNNIHAINNGLTPNSVVGISIKNINTGIVKEYISIAECSRDINLPHSTITNRLNRPQKFFPDGYIFKRKDSSWDDIILNKNNEGIRRKILGKNVMSNELIIADNIMAMAKITGVNTTSISNACRYNINKPVKQFLFKYEHDQTPFKDLDYNSLNRIKDNYINSPTI